MYLSPETPPPLEAISTAPAHFGGQAGVKMLARPEVQEVAAAAAEASSAAVTGATRQPF